MLLSSTAFEPNQPIPVCHTCDGEGISPSFQLRDVPEETVSLVLIADDPDSPSGDWVHWTVWNIDPATTEISEASPPKNAEEGMTSFQDIGYGGPCPHTGKHRYYFRLYALDTLLELPPEATKTDLLDAMDDHVICQTELMGTYERRH